MTGTRAAVRYAKAILETAHEKGVAEKVNDDMSLITSTIAGNDELKNFMLSPTISGDVKQNVLNEIFTDSGEVTKILFRLLFENKRLPLLEVVSSEYNRLFDEMNGYEVAHITTAVAMDADMEGKVHAKILTFSNKKVLIKNTIDPSILGGFILRMGDRQYNASVSNRLQVLKRELSN